MEKSRVLSCTAKQEYGTEQMLLKIRQNRRWSGHEFMKGDIKMANNRSIFISHSTVDKDYGMALKNLLVLLMPKQKVFLSSSDTQGVPVNQDINEIIKTEIRNGAYVIFLLSDNFYSSVACMNEMGATYVSGNNYALVVLPGFDIGGDNFRRSMINIHQKAIHMLNHYEILQLVESLSCLSDNAYNKQTAEEKCIAFISDIKSINKKNADNMEAYNRLRKAEKKIAEGIDLPEAYLERAEARAKVKEYSLAVQDYLFSIFLNPDNINTYNRMIQAVGIANAGFRKEVMTVAEEMCRRFPYDSRSYGCRGYVRLNNDDIEGAIADCDKALAIKENRWYYNTRGRCWAAKGRLEHGEMRECFWFKALQDYWHSHHVSPEYSIALENVRNMVTSITPERIEKEVEKAREVGDEKTVQIYKECLEIAGM